MERRPGFEPDRARGARSHSASYEHDPLTEKVIGAAIEVHRVLGPGYLESIYEEAMTHELALRQLAFQRQAPIAVHYKGKTLGEGRIDLLIEHKLIVELKATDGIAPAHTAQVLSYLKATRLKTGLLINFNTATLKDGLRRLSL